MSSAGSSLMSGGSGASSGGGAAHDSAFRSPEGLNGEADLVEPNQTIITGVFGVLYTVSKEKLDQAPKWAMTRIILDFLQLFILIFHPAYGWRYQQDLWLWKLMTYIDWRQPVVDRGYKFYNVILYLISAVLAASLAVSVYIAWAFKNTTMTTVWPLKVLRLYVSLFFQFFFIASLSAFLVALDCRLWGFTKDVRGMLAAFPDVECLAMPHLVHASVALVSALVFLAVSFAITLADFDVNPLSKRLLAAAHSHTEVRAWAVKTVMVIITVILGAFPKWQAGITLWMTWLLLWSYVRMAPHLTSWVNHVRCGLYTGIFWQAIMLVVLAFSSNKTDSFQSAITVGMLSGLVPAMALGLAVSRLRWRMTYDKAIWRFKNMPPGTKPRRIYNFLDVREVEICSRVSRQWEDVDEGMLDKKAMELGEAVIKTGMAMFPNNAQMTLTWASFLMDVQDSYHSGYSQLQLAKKLDTTLMEKYAIFVREQEHVLKASQSKSGDASVDLISYVEFQRNHRMVLRAHKAALYAIRDFWAHLMHSEVSFRSLIRCLGRIDAAKTHADKMYKTVVQRYPTSGKLLRAYARYLEDVKNDPWGAARYFREADRVEDLEEANNAATDLDLDHAEGLNQKTNAVVLTNSQGIIQMANKLAHDLFGYKKGDLEGKNVSVLMPPPFSQRHNGFMAKYVATGKGSIIGKVTQMLGLHKERHVFPVDVFVTKVSGNGADSMFMGVIKKSEADPSTVKVYLLPGSGVIAAADEGFESWFACKPLNIVGRSVGDLAVDRDVMHRLVEHAEEAREDDLMEGRVSMKHVRILHRYFEPVDTDVCVRMGGAISQRLLVLELKRNQAEDHFCVSDAKGRIRYMSEGLLRMLGHDAKQAAAGGLTMAALIPQPFSQMHAGWIKDQTGMVPPTSCRNGSVVSCITANKVQLPCRLSISTHEEQEEMVYVTKFTRVTVEEGVHERCLELHLDSQGNITGTSNSPQALFGFKPEVLIGHSLSEVVDVFKSAEAHGSTCSHILSLLTNRAVERPGYSWRVGVSPPLSDADAAQMGSLAETLAARQTKAAVMALRVADDHNGGSLVVMSLWRADLMMGIIEVDKDGLIQRTSDYPVQHAGMLFGVPDASLVKHPLSKFLHISSHNIDSLLDQKHRRASALKAAATSGVIVGPVKKMWGTHTDQQDLQVTVQATTKEGHTRRLLLLLRLAAPKKGNPEFGKLLLMQDNITRHMSGMGAASSIHGKNLMPEPGVSNEPIRSGADLLHEDGEEQQEAKKGGVKFAASAINDGDDDSVAEMSGRDGVLPEEQVQTTPSVYPEKLDRVANWVHTEGNKMQPSINRTESLGKNSDHSFEAPSEHGAASVASADPETASQVSGSTLGGGVSQAGEEMQTDYRRGKRYKKLYKLLAGPDAQARAKRFNLHSLISVAGMLAVHVVCFVILISLLNTQVNNVHDMNSAAAANRYVQTATLYSRAAVNIYTGRVNPNIYSMDNEPWIMDQLEGAIDEFEVRHQKVYLGKPSHLRQLPESNHLRESFDGYSLNITRIYDSQDTEFQMTNLWELGNEFVVSAREVHHNLPLWSERGQDVVKTRDFQFLILNGQTYLFQGYLEVNDNMVYQTLDATHHVNDTQVALMIAEGVVFTLLLCLYLARLLRAVAEQRYALYSMFFIIPQGFTRALATKQVLVEDDSDADSDSEPENIMPTSNNQQAESAKPVENNIKLAITALPISTKKQSWKERIITALMFWKPSHSSNSDAATGRRTLLRNSKDAYRLILPFLFWAVLLITVYAIGCGRLGGAADPVATLNIVNYVRFRAQRTLTYAQGLVSQSTPEGRDKYRGLLAACIQYLEDDYKVMLYGAHGATTVEKHYQYVKRGVAFAASHIAAIMFRERGCKRMQQDTCLPPSHEYYEISQAGIDAIMSRFMQEAEILARAPDANLTLANPHFDFMWHLGLFDLYDGLEYVNEDFVQKVAGLYTSVRSLHIILFVASWLLAALFVMLMLRPFARRVELESKQVAELLSQLPRELDVEGVVARALTTQGGADESDDVQAAPAAGKGPQPAKTRMMKKFSSNNSFQYTA